MEALFSGICAGAAVLFVVAVAVAWWEHLVRNARPPVVPSTQLPRAVSVDVSLDSLVPASPAPAAEGDAAARRATLDSAMGRMARRTQAEPDAWLETNPMVLQPLVEQPPAAGQQAQAPTRA